MAVWEGVGLNLGLFGFEVAFCCLIFVGFWIRVLIFLRFFLSIFNKDVICFLVCFLVVFRGLMREGFGIQLLVLVVINNVFQFCCFLDLKLGGFINEKGCFILDVYRKGLELFIRQNVLFVYVFIYFRMIYFSQDIFFTYIVFI